MLRHASQFNARRHVLAPRDSSRVSPKAVVRLAAAAGIPEEDVRLAIQDLSAEEAADPETISRKVLGRARTRAVRELDLPQESAREHLETLLRVDQGLKLRQRTGAGSLWDAGGKLGALRQTTDPYGERPLLKAYSLELQVEEPEGGRCSAELTADISNQRGEYLSLAGIVGATVAVLFAIAGFQDPLFFFGVLPAVVAPGYGFRLAYQRRRSEVHHALDALLDEAESVALPRREQKYPGDLPPSGRSSGRVRDLRPIPKFTPNREE